MSIKVEVSQPNLVFCAPVNEGTSKWGVYCIPRLWRMPTGELVIRFNGEEDCCLVEEMQRVPNMYFLSRDEGETWQQVENGEELFDYNAILGIDSPYIKLRNGKWLCIREKDNRVPIGNQKHIKEFKLPDGEAIVYDYYYGDIPEECKGIEVVEFNPETGEKIVFEAIIDFPEREILVNALAPNEEGEYIPVPKLLRPYIFKNPYIGAIKELSDGTLIATACGQHPDVYDDNCGIVYLVASEDGGHTWKKRGVIAEDTSKYLYGYAGDGYENTLTIAENGDLLCVMRMDMTVNQLYERPLCDTMLAISKDNGYTWSEPVSISDCSITPHIEALKDDIVFFVYGRPGVHFKYSCDNGATWSDSVSIIGNTLEEERALGKPDIVSKYEDTPSYSNSFVEKISDDTVLVLYTDLKYNPGDGINHKAGFVKKITITRE